MSNTINGSAIAIVSSQGTGQGFYKEKGGFLSDQKKIFDGFYYQEFSYDVISSLQLNKYQDILKKVVHTAGFIFFGTLEYISQVEAANLSVATTSFVSYVDEHGIDSQSDDSFVLDRDGNFVLTRGEESVIQT